MQSQEPARHQVLAASSMISPHGNNEYISTQHSNNQLPHQPSSGENQSEQQQPVLTTKKMRKHATLVDGPAAHGQPLQQHSQRLRQADKFQTI